MNKYLGRVIAGSLALIGIGLILGGMTLAGILAASSGAGLWMADFHLESGQAGRRLIAKGTPALLLLPLMLGAGKAYMVTAETVFPTNSAHANVCPTEDAGHSLWTVRILGSD